MIDRMKADFPIQYLCRKFGVSESGYHAWRSRPPSARAVWRVMLEAKVLGAFLASERASGHRKITAELRIGRAFPVDRKSVLKAMKAMQLMPPAAEAAFKRAEARARLTDDPPDLLERRFDETVEPGTVMVGDITYVRTEQGWLYVASVIDLATRAVIGWASSARQTAGLVVTALNRAIRTGLVTPNAIFHSDHGTQYRSKRFTRFCHRQSIRRSMGKNFQCWDNAVAESFFSKLKGERLRWHRFATRAQATYEVADYVHHFNTRRRHQSLGYATPAETMTALTGQSIAA